MNYPETQKYYDLFNNTVKAFYANESGKSSSLTSISIEKDLFNNETANNVHKVKTIDEEYYEYLFIQPTAAVTLEDFGLYVKATETLKFEVRFYLTNDMPLTTEVRAFAQDMSDDDGESAIYKDDYKNPIHTSETATKENIWQSIYSAEWNVDGKNSRYIDIGVSTYIVVQFLNNTGYGADLGYEPVKFSIVNLMLSPKNEKYAVTTD